MGNIQQNIDDTKELSELYYLLKKYKDEDNVKDYIQQKIDIINEINNNIKIAEIHRNRTQRSKLYEILDKSGNPTKMETLYKKTMEKYPVDYFKNKKVKSIKKSINKSKNKSKPKRVL
jgi:hypothetical protein